MPHPRTCSIENCDLKHEARGFCIKHYKRWLRNGDPNKVFRSRIPISTDRHCSVDGCTEKYHAKGVCSKHYRTLDTSKRNEAKLRKQNRQKRREYLRNHRINNLNYRLSEALRGRLWNILRGKQKAGSSVDDLGCTIDELKQHLEAQFSDGMNWDNWSRDGWHIDHIVPLASFDLTDRDQFLKATHFTNLQPLWAKENLSKGSNTT